MQVAPMEAVPARAQKGKTFGEVFFREAKALCPNSVGLRHLPSVSDAWGLHKCRAKLKKFAQYTRIKIILPLFRFQNNVYDFSYRRQCFFGEYVSEMLYLGDIRRVPSNRVISSPFSHNIFFHEIS
jgi:hypothetical protein